jgi:hypothetical protein
VFALGALGYRQPASLPPSETGVQAGRLGLICCVSVGAEVLKLTGMLMK